MGGLLMDARESTLFGLLDGSKHYSIPHYQRLYSWDTKHCDQLFDDLVRLVRNPDRRHFMGSVVYVSHTAKADGINNFVVIDGQQRLTTLSLIILATLKSMNISIEDRKKRLNRTVKNSDESSDSPVYLKLNLTRTDNPSYRSIVHSVESAVPLEPENSRIQRNFLHIEHRLADSGIHPEDIWAAILKLDMVYISLEKGKDDPQAIFESLNSTGKSLSSTDLIRNFILMDQTQGDQVSLYENYWAKIEELFRDRKDTEFDEFTRAYLAAKLERYPKKTEVYEEFKHSVRDAYENEETPQDVLGQFRDSAKSYAFIHWQKDTDSPGFLMQALEDYRALGLRLLHPLLLEYARKNVQGAKYDPKVFEKAISLLESYLVRRAFCGLRSNSLDNMMASIFTLKGKSKFDGVDSLADALLSLGGKARFPLDEEVKYRGQMMDLYNSANKEHILRRLERYGDPKGMGLSAKVSIEHVMPQKLTRSWSESLGSDAEKVRDRLVHTIGNLTLTPYNSQLGQRTFDEKKELITGGFETSKIWLSSTLLQYDKWDEASIMSRGEFLMDAALEVWPMPSIFNGGYRKIEVQGAKADLDLRALLMAEKVDVDDEIVWVRPQSGETHRGRITESGTIVTAEGEEFETPTAATRAFTSSSYNGWKEWRHLSENGPTLDELRDQVLDEE